MGGGHCLQVAQRRVARAHLGLRVQLRQAGKARVGTRIRSRGRPAGGGCALEQVVALHPGALRGAACAARPSVPSARCHLPGIHPHNGFDILAQEAVD